MVQIVKNRVTVKCPICNEEIEVSKIQTRTEALQVHLKGGHKV